MTRPKLTVWYNTKCPVCSAGIDWQRSRLVRVALVGTIEFRDNNLQPDALASFGADVEDVRRRLHAVTFIRPQTPSARRQRSHRS